MANNNELTVEELIAMGLLNANANAVAQPVVANNREAAINASVDAARTAFNRNFRNEVTALEFNNAEQEQQFLNMRLQESKHQREAAKATANAGLYNEAKAVLLSENAKLRKSVLKTVALDDIIIEERIKLEHAKTDEERRAAATKIYNAQKLKDELDAARHRSKAPTAEQNQRYANLTRNVNFNAIPFSLYPRLVKNNEKRTKNNAAASKIAAFKRGYTQRRKYKSTLNEMRAARNAEAYVPMIPMGNFFPSKNQGHFLGSANAATLAAVHAAVPAAAAASAAAAAAAKENQRKLFAESAEKRAREAAAAAADAAAAAAAKANQRKRAADAAEKRAKEAKKPSQGGKWKTQRRRR